MFIPLLGKDKGFVCKENLTARTAFLTGTSMFSSNVVHKLLLRALCQPFLSST